MKRIVLLLAAYCMFFFTAGAQLDIRHADSTPLRHTYCPTEEDVILMGIPAGGTFSGCGVFQQNSRWYFSPQQISSGGSMTRSCSLKYVLGNDSVIKELYIDNFGVAIDDDRVSCSDSFFLLGEEKVVGDFSRVWTGPGIYRHSTNSKLAYASLMPGTRGTYIYEASNKYTGCIVRDSVVIEVGTKRPLNLHFNGYRDSVTIHPGTITLATRANRDYQVIKWLPADKLPDQTAREQIYPVPDPQRRYYASAYAKADDGCVDAVYLFIRTSWPAQIENTPPEDQQISIYPNPASETITIHAPGAASIKIYDISGKILLHQSVNKAYETINIRDFAAGTYTAVVAVPGKEAQPVRFIKIEHK